MDTNTSHEAAEATSSSSSSSSSCNCFGFPCFGSGSDGHHLLEKRDQPDSWWVLKAKKARVWSEVVAGPKWKNFIRKIGRRRGCNFQYDSFDYALNFDQQGGDDADPDHHPYTFSARFTAPHTSTSTTPQIS